MFAPDRSRSRFLLGLLLMFATTLLPGVLAAESGTLTASEAHRLASNGKLMLIDVRTAPEWRATGVAPQARRLDLQTSTGPAHFARQVLKLTNGDPDTAIALICRTGNRSGYAQHALLEHGFTQVYNVSEGMAGSAAGQGWIAHDLPLVPCDGC